MTIAAAQLPEDPVAAARAYDLWFDGDWGRYAYAVEVAAICDALGPLLGTRILDAGCGTGRLLRRLVAAGARPTGLDVDAGMLEVAGERARVPLVRDDIRALPFESETFDAAVAITVLECVDGVPRAISELCRVTRPGGRIVIGALNPRSPWGARTPPAVPGSALDPSAIPDSPRSAPARLHVGTGESPWRPLRAQPRAQSTAARRCDRGRREGRAVRWRCSDLGHRAKRVRWM